jgi:hypothetical protein
LFCWDLSIADEFNYKIKKPPDFLGRLLLYPNNMAYYKDKSVTTHAGPGSQINDFLYSIAVFILKAKVDNIYTVNNVHEKKLIKK